MAKTPKDTRRVDHLACSVVEGLLGRPEVVQSLIQAEEELGTDRNEIFADWVYTIAEKLVERSEEID